MPSAPGAYWGCDVPISMPEPTQDDVLIDMGAHGFSINGLVNNLSATDVEDYKIPTFAPDGTVHGQ